MKTVHNARRATTKHVRRSVRETILWDSRCAVQIRPLQGTQVLPGKTYTRAITEASMSDITANRVEKARYTNGYGRRWLFRRLP